MLKKTRQRLHIPHLEGISRHPLLHFVCDSAGYDHGFSEYAAAAAFSSA